MHKRILQRIIKIISILIGLYGVFLTLVFGLLAFDLALVRNTTETFIYFSGMLFGVFIVWVTYKVVWHYSVTSIKLLSIVIVFLCVGLINMFARPYMEKLNESTETWILVISSFIPIFIVVASYFLLVYLLKRLTIEVNSAGNIN